MAARHGSRTIHRPEGAGFILFARSVRYPNGEPGLQVMSQHILSADTVSIRLDKARVRKQPRDNASEFRNSM